MKDNSINYRRLFRKALQYWYLFAIIFPLAVGLAYLHLRATPKKYEAYAMLLIKDEEKSGQIAEEAIFDDLGLLGKKKRSLENEVHILKSTPLMESVVQNRELQYEYYSLAFLKKRDLGKNSPVRIVDWKPANEVALVEGELNFDKGGNYRLKIDKQEYTGEFGKELRIAEGKLTLSLTRASDFAGPVGLRILTPREKAKEFLENLDVTAMGEQSSTLSMTIKDYVPERAEVVLTELIKLYNQQSIEDKNKVFENSLNLLNERINLLAQELSVVEQDVESYKQRFNLLEISAEGSILMRDLADYNKDIAGTEIQLEILSGIEDFLNKNRETFEFVPTNLSINNLTLTNQIGSFNDLLREREKQRTIYGPAHQDVQLVEKQVKNLRQTIVENIRSIKSDVQIGRNAKKELSSGVENRIFSLPRRERELFDIERRKTLKEDLYLFLIHKREQAAISLAVTTATGRVIEPAEAIPQPISPRPAQIALIAFFLGLAIPAGIVFFMVSLNNKVLTEEDIQNVTPVPIAGVLVQSRKKSRVVVKENSTTAAAEMFRSLRANLAYIAPGEELKVMLVTSSIPGEGKSFIALNMGITQALAGKKVVLVELDLRKPSQEFEDIELTEEGVVNYLISPKPMNIDKIINNTGLHLNFDVIKCGPKPPNPSELLLSNRLRELVSALKERYDFVILDTPPVGVVADALQIKDVADATLYVVRSGYTRKAQVQIVNEIIQKGKLPRPFIVLNGVKLDKRSAGGYYASYYGEEK